MLNLYSIKTVCYLLQMANFPGPFCKEAAGLGSSLSCVGKDACVCVCVCVCVRAHAYAHAGFQKKKHWGTDTSSTLCKLISSSLLHALACCFYLCYLLTRCFATSTIWLCLIK